VAESEDKGRCVNCGFLAKRTRSDPSNRASTPKYYEVESEARKNGEVWSYVQDSRIGPIGTEPFCFRQAAQIADEILSITGQFGSDRMAARDVFVKDRNCKSWYRYNPGLNPKDHFDQMNMELLENARRDFELRLEKDRKEFDLRLFEISQKIQEDSRKIASRSFWFNLFFTFVLIVLTLIQIFLAMDWGRATFRQLAEQLGNLLIQKMSGG
jgi:hypothetical protein